MFHCIELERNEFVKRRLISKSFWSYKIFGLSWHNILGSTWDTKSYAFVLYCPLYIHVCCFKWTHIYSVHDIGVLSTIMTFELQRMHVNWSDLAHSFYSLNAPVHAESADCRWTFCSTRKSSLQGGATWELARCIGQPPNSSHIYSDQLFFQGISLSCLARLWNEWYR